MSQQPSPPDPLGPGIPPPPPPPAAPFPAPAVFAPAPAVDAAPSYPAPPASPTPVVAPPPPPPTPAVAAPSPVPPTAPPATLTGDPDEGPKAGAAVEVSAERPTIERYLASMVLNGSSDLHLATDQVPRTREAGKLLPMAGEQPLSADELEAMCKEILSEHAWNEYTSTNDVDTAYAMSTDTGAAVTSRFRVNLFRSMGTPGAVIRVIPEKIVTLDELGLLPQIRKLAQLPRGLVLFCGPTGSGKAKCLDTLTPIPSGWTTLGELAIGDKVIGRDGRPCSVTGLSEISETPDLYRVKFSDGQEILADGQHQWLVSTHHARSMPRTKKRSSAINRYRNAHLDADAIESLAQYYGSDDALTDAELHEVLVTQKLAGEFPSKTSVYNALRMTDCPSHGASRFSTARAETKEVGPWRYPVKDVLDGVVDGNGPRAADAAELLASGNHPEHATTIEIARLLGAENHSVARGIVDKRQVRGIPTRVDTIERGAKQAAVVEYPAQVALKSLALRLRQRFDVMPLDAPELFRMETAEMIANGLRLGTGHSNFAVPVTAALELPAADLPLDPYVFGAWLGDGGTSTGTIAADPAKKGEPVSDMELMREQIEAAGYATADPSDSAPYVIRTKGLRTALRATGAFGAKHIPIAYARASAEQRLAVLQGLMDTDGTADVNGSCELSLSDRRLATDALDLIRGLGIKASISYDNPASYRDADGELVECKDRHRIHFTTDQPVFRLPRKARRLPTTVRETQQWNYITDITPVLPGDADYGPVRCITVDSPDHTYLCGDGYVVTSNSTSMAALVNEMNETRYERIFTLEDPIEFVHQSKNCLISHREIGEDTASFEEGLRRVRREDPDIILVGEMRDYETIASAIEAADTGHLVIATLHTNSAPETISRIINQFPASQQDQVRTTLASTLKAVICQTLVPSPKSPRGRVLANEVMFVNSAIANLIRENDIPQIFGALVDQSGGNMSLDAHLAILFQQGLITKKEALKKASTERAFNNALGSSE